MAGKGVSHISCIQPVEGANEIGEKMKGSLLKGNFDKRVPIDFFFLCLSPPHSHPPHPLRKTTAHHPPEPDPQTSPPAAPTGTRTPLRKQPLSFCPTSDQRSQPITHIRLPEFLHKELFCGVRSPIHRDRRFQVFRLLPDRPLKLHLKI